MPVLVSLIWLVGWLFFVVVVVLFCFFKLESSKRKLKLRKSNWPIGKPMEHCLD